MVDVVGDVEQSGDEQLVAVDAFGAVGVAIGGGITGGQRRLFDDETALGADRHDDRVLDGLRLDQTQDLGAEVLPTVRPPQATARYVTESQVHTFDAGRVHEDLELRARQRKLFDQLRIQFQRQHILTAGRSLLCHKVIGAQRSLNQLGECAQDAVGIHTHQRVDVRGDRRRGSLRVTALRRARWIGIEQRLEQCDQ